MSTHTNRRFDIGHRARERGATLVVGLVLLLVLTVLGVSSMNTATLELTMASNAQSHQDAFQAAETGIDIAISSPPFTTVAPAVLPATSLGDGSYDTQAVTRYMDPPTPVPDIAFSMGVGTTSPVAYHFDIVATGRGPRNATSTHNQSFYIVGPGGP